MATRPPGTPDVDLTFDGASGTINGGVFMTGQFQLGPDHFSSFLEIRHNGSEQGYNTDGTFQFNERDTQNSTHSILLANVPIVIGDGSNGTEEGVAYREFRLNIAEAGNTKQYLSLDGLQIWQEELGDLTNFTPGSGFTGSHTNYLAYNLDAGGNHWVGLLEPSNGNGANQTEFTVLIPDANFINDPTHRYITLYADFGLQAGWESDSNSEEWGLNGSSTGPTPAMTIHKTATVPGGTADVAGEVISYAITVANVGDVSLTGVTLTDPSVSNLAPVLSAGFNVGDTNHDNKLSAGETWQYTASYTVTQDDLNTNAQGRGAIINTVTASSGQTAPVSASTSVTVETSASLELVKMADVSSVNAAGDAINYTITVENTGTVLLNGIVVTDTQVHIVTPILDFSAPVLGGPPLVGQVLIGDYNAGDTNQNGVQDPGETFQYRIVGDDNGNGVQDPGETFQFTNIGDTNQNGVNDPGETFQFYNAGDTNHNGVEDSGETFQFNVDNTVPGVDANHDGLNDGDTNFDGNLNVGETWLYALSYTVTQDDIDHRVGGIPTVVPGLTHDNTALVTTNQGVIGTESVSVAIDQNPHLTVTKTASIPDADGDGKIDSPADDITYTITVVNDGNMTLTGVNLSDSLVGMLTTHTETGGNPATNGDGELNVGETWTYTAVYDTQQSDIDNRGNVDGTADDSIHNVATVTTTQGAGGAAAADVAIDYQPHLTVTKTASIPDSDSDGKIDSPADDITYTITVVNDGNVTLTGVIAGDSILGPLTSHTDTGAGTHGDGILDVGETWTYTAVYDTQQSDIDNHGNVDGTADDSIHNVATVTTTQGAGGAAAADVAIDYQPNFTFTVTPLGYHDVNGNSVADAGDIIDFSTLVTNTGNVTLTSVAISNEDGLIVFPNGPIASLAPADSDGTITGTHLIQAGETDLDETEIGQSDQVGNILLLLHVHYADLVALA